MCNTLVLSAQTSDGDVNGAGLAEKLVKVADELMQSAQGSSEEQLTGRFWVVQKIIQECLRHKEQLVIFSEHLANLDYIAAFMNKVAALLHVQSYDEGSSVLL